jgi:hypothetical protein
MNARVSRDEAGGMVLSRADLTIILNCILSVLHPAPVGPPRPVCPVDLEQAESLWTRLNRELVPRGWRPWRQRFQRPEARAHVRLSATDHAVLILCVRATLGAFGEDFDFQSRIGYKSGQTRKMRNRLQKNYGDLVGERSHS